MLLLKKWMLSLIIAVMSLSLMADTPPVEKMVLSNGATIISVTEPNARVITLHGFFKVGLWAEPEGQAGIRHLVARCLFGSSENQSREEIATEIDRVGGAVYVNPAPDMIELGISTIGDQFANASYLLCDAVKNPRFEPKELDVARTVCLNDLEAEKTSQFRVAFRLLRGLVLPEASSYGHSLIGDRSFLQTATAQQCQNFANANLTADRLVIVVIGNLPSKQVFSRFTTLLDEWRTKSSVQRPEPTAYKPMQDELTDLEMMPSATAYLGVGVTAPGMLSPD